MNNIVNFPDPEAKKKWNSITPADQQMFLNNAWCTQCSNVTELKEPTFENVSQDLLIKGHCKTCNFDVARLIEMS